MKMIRVFRRIIRTVVLTGIMLLPLTVIYGQTLVSHLVAGCDNYLHINGESNVNQFSFTYSSVPKYNPHADTIGEVMEMSIPIKDFQASNPMMYSDFLELMNEEEHPRIYIAFSRLQLETALKGISEPCPEISITIAGITRTYVVNFMIEKCSGNYYLKGSEIIRLSDFKLRPPAKLLGLVKVSNEIDVNFGFIITFTDNTNFASTL